MMEKFLLSLSEDQAAGGEAILNTIKLAVLPIAKVFMVCFMGFLMASKYVSILPANEWGPGVGSRRLGFRTMAAIVFTRLILVPPVGLGIVTLVDKLGFIPKGDKMFKFVLLLQHSMPTSVLSGAVANLQGCGKEAAAVLFWIHIFSVISMAGWIILYLAILF